MAVYHGKTGALYMSTTGTGTASAVAYLTNWSLELGAETVETTAFGDTNRTYVRGLPDLSGDFSGFWDDASETLFSASDSADGVKMYLYPTTLVDTKYWYGPAWMTVSVETAVDDAVKVSGSFSAKGAWGRNWA